MSHGKKRKRKDLSHYMGLEGMEPLLEKLSLHFPTQSDGVDVTKTPTIPFHTLVVAIRNGMTTCSVVGLVKSLLKDIGPVANKILTDRVNTRRYRELVINKLVADVVKEPRLKRFLHYDGKVVERLVKNKTVKCISGKTV